MKKLISVLLLSVLLLCSCGSNQGDPESSSMIEINYDKIARRNNRTVLMNKYDYIKETTEYFALDTEEVIPNWSMEYSLDEETGMNVQFIYGNERQYFYNETMYAAFGESDIRVIIPFKSDYSTLIQERLKRENTLNYVYYKQNEGNKTENGYAVSYSFTVTSDVLDEFMYWDIHVGDTIKVDYELNTDFEILNYTYYIVDNPYSDNPVFTKIMTSSTEFNNAFKFPQFVYECDTSEKVTITVKENYNKPSQIVESFKVPTGIRLWGDENLISSEAYTDDKLKNAWNFEEDLITEDLTLYTIPYVEPQQFQIIDIGDLQLDKEQQEEQ